MPASGALLPRGHNRAPAGHRRRSGTRPGVADAPDTTIASSSTSTPSTTARSTPTSRANILSSRTPPPAFLENQHSNSRNPRTRAACAYSATHGNDRTAGFNASRRARETTPTHSYVWFRIRRHPRQQTAAVRSPAVAAPAAPTTSSRPPTQALYDPRRGNPAGRLVRIHDGDPRRSGGQREASGRLGPSPTRRPAAVPVVALTTAQPKSPLRPRGALPRSRS